MGLLGARRPVNALSVDAMGQPSGWPFSFGAVSGCAGLCRPPAQRERRRAAGFGSVVSFVPANASPYIYGKDLRFLLRRKESE